MRNDLLSRNDLDNLLKHCLKFIVLGASSAIAHNPLIGSEQAIGADVTGMFKAAASLRSE